MFIVIIPRRAASVRATTTRARPIPMPASVMLRRTVFLHVSDNVDPTVVPYQYCRDAGLALKEVLSFPGAEEKGRLRHNLGLLDGFAEDRHLGEVRLGW